MKSCRMAARLVSLPGLACCFLFFVVLTGAFTQETTLRSRSNLVLLVTLVKDPQGAIMYGLQAKDFIVEDDGVEQPVQLDEPPEGQPISLVVAIQRGRRASYEFPRMQGLRTMLNPLFASGTTRMAVVEFDSHVELTGPFDLTAPREVGDLSSGKIPHPLQRIPGQLENPGWTSESMLV